MDAEKDDKNATESPNDVCYHAHALAADLVDESRRQETDGDKHECKATHKRDAVQKNAEGTVHRRTGVSTNSG